MLFVTFSPSWRPCKRLSGFQHHPSATQASFRRFVQHRMPGALWAQERHAVLAQPATGLDAPAQSSKVSSVTVEAVPSLGKDRAVVNQTDINWWQLGSARLSPWRHHMLSNPETFPHIAQRVHFHLMNSAHQGAKRSARLCTSSSTTSMWPPKHANIIGEVPSAERSSTRPKPTWWVGRGGEKGAPWLQGVWGVAQKTFPEGPAYSYLGEVCGVVQSCCINTKSYKINSNQQNHPKRQNKKIKGGSKAQTRNYTFSTGSAPVAQWKAPGHVRWLLWLPLPTWNLCGVHQSGHITRQPSWPTNATCAHVWTKPGLFKATRLTTTDRRVPFLMMQFSCSSQELISRIGLS